MGYDLLELMLITLTYLPIVIQKRVATIFRDSILKSVLEKQYIPVLSHSES